MEYLQPTFYHFSDDSIWLVEKAIEQIRNINREISVLDLGAGCGIVGIELALKHTKNIRICFLEKQSEFQPFLEENINNFISEVETKTYIKDIQNFDTKYKYDLIISNPPYFESGKGRPSPSLNRNTCRTFQEVGLIQWFELASRFINKGGRFIFLVHESNQEHRELLEKENIQILDQRDDRLILEALYKE